MTSTKEGGGGGGDDGGRGGLLDGADSFLFFLAFCCFCFVAINGGDSLRSNEI